MTRVRRMRRRVAPAPRRPWRRVAVVFALGLLLLAALGLRVGEVRVRGAVAADADRLAGLLRPELGERWLLAGRGGLEASLAEDPWVEWVEITRRLPGTLVVRVHERTAMLVLPGGEAAVDAAGHRLPWRAGMEWAGLPVLELPGDEPWERHWPQVQDLVAAVGRAGWPLRSPLRAIVVGEGGELQLRTEAGTTLRLGGGSYAERLHRLAGARDRLEPGPGDVIDLRFDRQVILRPQGT